MSLQLKNINYFNKTSHISDAMLVLIIEPRDTNKDCSLGCCHNLSCKLKDPFYRFASEGNVTANCKAQNNILI